MNLDLPMSYDSFLNYVKEHLFDSDPQMGASTEIMIHDVRKNNDSVNPAITIRKEGEPVAPTLYPFDVYKDYCDGKSLDKCVEQIKNMYETCEVPDANPVAFFHKFEDTKDKIWIRVVNTELNQERLKELPSYTFGDLAVIFYADVKDFAADVRGSITIKNEHLDMWGIDKGVLLETVKENAERFHKPTVESMKSIVGPILGDEDFVMDMPDQMYVLTNEDKLYGAVTMLDSDKLEALAEQLDSSFYVLPSSVHECILFTDMDAPADILRDMVSEINLTQVSPTERLSDNVYLYDKDAKQLFRTDTMEPMQFVNDTKVHRYVIKPEEMKASKQESIKEKMAGYKETVKKADLSEKKNYEKKNDISRE